MAKHSVVAMGRDLPTLQIPSEYSVYSVVTSQPQRSRRKRTAALPGGLNAPIINIGEVRGGRHGLTRIYDATGTRLGAEVRKCPEVLHH